MTAQEVWEVWEKDPKKRFKKKGGGYKIHLITMQIEELENEELLPLEDFMNAEWEPVDEQMVEMKLQEAMIRASTGQVVKVLDESRNIFFDIKKDSQLTPYAMTKFRYFAKEEQDERNGSMGILERTSRRHLQR